MRGEIRALKYSRRDVFKIALAATASAKASRLGLASVRCSPDRPHILLIMADQHRGDCIGADGNSTIRTPNLDTIATEGARFRRAYTSTPSCIPARAAILTGLSPWHHGLLGMSAWPIPERYSFELPRALCDTGYYPVTIGKTHFHPARASHGFEKMLVDEHDDNPPAFRTDYHSWFWTSAPNLEPEALGLGWNDYPAKAYPFPEHLHRTRWVGETAIQFLRTYDRPQPFFLKVSFIPPHSPYVPPERFMRQYTDEDLPKAVSGKWAERYRPLSGSKLDIWHGDLGSAQVHQSRAGYYGSVSHVDEEIGRILQALDERRWLEETLIFYTTDHGDMLGDHHLWRKCQPYEPSTRIPMLMRWPKGLITSGRGRVVSETVELRDILPTFLETAGISPPDHLDGRSLLGLVAGKAGGWREYVELEHDLCYSPAVHWNALTDGHMKYIFHACDGEEQLFDLDRDPQEINDLAPDAQYRARLRQWRQRLVDHLAVRGEEWVKNGELVLRPKSMPISPNYPREKTAKGR